MDLIGWLFVVAIITVIVYQTSTRNEARKNFLASAVGSPFTSYQDFLHADIKSIIWVGDYRGGWTLRDSRYSYAKLLVKHGYFIGAESAEGAFIPEQSGFFRSHIIIVNAQTKSVIAEIDKPFGSTRYIIDLPSGVKYSFINRQLFAEEDSIILSLEASKDWREEYFINAKPSLIEHKYLLLLLIISKYLIQLESWEAD
jgi:hypothetical protein